MIQTLIGSVDREATAIFIICGFFLILFVVAGVYDILQRKKDESDKSQQNQTD